MCKSMKKYHLQEPEDAPSGKNGEVQGVYTGKVDWEQLESYLKDQRERSGTRGFAFYEENTGFNLEDILEREWEGIFEEKRPFYYSCTITGRKAVISEDEDGINS